MLYDTHRYLSAGTSSITCGAFPFVTASRKIRPSSAPPQVMLPVRAQRGVVQAPRAAFEYAQRGTEAERGCEQALVGSCRPASCRPSQGAPPPADNSWILFYFIRKRTDEKIHTEANDYLSVQ
jgi:hypothetical protein